MAVPFIKESFNCGEISPELYGEVSLNKYSSAATTARNGIVNYKGGFLSRGGFAYIDRTKQSASGNGSLVFTTNPTNGQTIVLNGITWTFVTSGATGNQTNIGGSLAVTLTSLQSDLNGPSVFTTAFFAYVAPATLTVTYKTTAGIGTQFALNGGTSGAVPSAAALTVYPPRIIPFQFSITQGYEIEFGERYLRFVFQGGYVLENPVNITGITGADPGVVSAPLHGFVTGDWVFFSGVGGMTQINGVTAIVGAYLSGSFALVDLNGNALDTSAFSAYTSGGTVSRLYTVVTPYAAVDLPYLKYSQSADVMTLTCSNTSTGTEYPPYDLTRLSAIDWTLVETSFDAVISPPANVSASANFTATMASQGVNATFAYQVTAVDRNGNESIASQTAYCHGIDLEVQAGTNTLTWSYVSGAVSYNVYRAPASVDSSGGAPNINPPPGSIFGLVGSAFGTQLLDTNSTPDITQTPPTHQNPFAPGQILAVNITDGGTGITAVTYSITSSTGNNFVGYAVIAGGSLGAVPIVNAGEDYLPGDSIAFNGVGFASGSITFAANPNNGETITLNGVVWTFVTVITGANQTMIGGAVSTTLSSLASDLSASSNGSIVVAAYSFSPTTDALLINYKMAGTGGNSYTLAASVATRSGPTLTGGAGAAGAKASGTYTFTTNPTNSQTIILNGVTWTFVTGSATGNQTHIGVSTSATLTQLASDLNASTNGSIDVATYTASPTVLTIQYGTVGVAGNGYTLAAGTYGGTISGGNLTGGANGPDLPAATLVVGPDSGTYPGVSAYLQQRRFYANSFNDPDTFWASQTGRFYNFDASIPTIATDAITASPWTEQVNGIQWLIPMPGGLIAMTGQRAWQIVGQGSYALNVAPITPSTTQAQAQAFNGCSATVPPVVIDLELLYVQSVDNATVYDLSWNFFSNIYTGTDLTILSSHLFLYHKITQWAFCREPYKVVWACRDDGTMLSLTYMKEQQVYGWARHDTLGLIVSVSSITEPPVNALYAIVQRFPPYAPAGIFTMERMDNRIWQSVEDAFAVDSAVSNPAFYPGAACYASASSGAAVAFKTTEPIFSAGNVGQIIRLGGGIATITGYVSPYEVLGTWGLAASPGPLGTPSATATQWSLSTAIETISAPHLAGMTVAGLADGVPLSGLVVGSDGTVTLPFPASNVKVGLPFMVQLQTPYLNGQSQATMQGRRKMIPAVTIRVAGSGAFQVGTNQPDGAAQNPPQLGPAWTNLANAKLTSMTYTSVGGATVQQIMTGDERVIVSGDYSKPGQVAIQQSRPLPLEVIAAIPETVEGDLPEPGYSQRGNSDSGQGRGPRGPGRWQLGT